MLFQNLYFHWETLTDQTFLFLIYKQVHKDWRQGVRVQSQFPSHFTHQACQPSLSARAAGPVHLNKFHSDQRRSGGPAADCRGQHGETWSGTAEGEKVSVGKEQPCLIQLFDNKGEFWQIRFHPICYRNVKVNLSRHERSICHTARMLSENKQAFHDGLFEFLS